MSKTTDSNPAPTNYSLLGGRAAAGGLLMGLANLVPGISGGTMLVAAGVYQGFIEAIAEVTTLKFQKKSLFLLGVIVVMAVLAILAFAGPVKSLVVEHRWIMYSLFIGLTLGGVPVVWAMAKPATSGTWAGAAAGLLGMSALAYFQMTSAGGASENTGWMMMFFAGVAGASAMILPGVSGGYLLLVLGVYVPILGGISSFKDALKALVKGDGGLEAMLGPFLDIVLPVGLGVVIGIAVVANVLKVLLAKHEKPTLGVLLGLLVGAVVGLWPFQEGVAPVVGAVFKGRVMTAELIAEIAPEKYPTELFTPSAAQVAGGLALVLVGFGITALVARLGRDKPIEQVAPA